MIHERFFHRALLRLLCAACALFSVLPLSSCKGSRQVAKAAEVRESVYYTDSLFVDSKLQLDTVRAERRDTARAVATESGTILIQHNDNGQPERIVWEVKKTSQAVKHGNTEKERWFYGLNATRYSEVADTMHTVSTETEEVTQTYDTAISLEKVIGPVLLGLVFIYLIFVLIVDKLLPWIRKQRSQ